MNELNLTTRHQRCQWCMSKHGGAFDPRCAGFTRRNRCFDYIRTRVSLPSHPKVIHSYGSLPYSSLLRVFGCLLTHGGGSARSTFNSESDFFGPARSHDVWCLQYSPGHTFAWSQRSSHGAFHTKRRRKTRPRVFEISYRAGSIGRWSFLEPIFGLTKRRIFYPSDSA